MSRSGLAVVALLFLGCDEGSSEPAALAFSARIADQAAGCDVTAPLGSSGTPATLADARFFVSRVQLRNDGGEWIDLVLDDTAWQQPDLALLDFEDGTGACADSGTAETNTELVGTLSDGVYDAVRFDVGVPFERNHLDSATAPAPLNAPGMFWAWQSGYKFVRVDWAVDGSVIPRWNVHVGAGGCVSDAPTIAPATECDRPNRARVVLEDLDPLTDTIDVDLGQLVAGADLAQNTEDSPPGCMSSPTEPDECGPVYGALGLDFATGDCVADCADQAIFGVQ